METSIKGKEKQRGIVIDRTNIEVSILGDGIY